MQNSKENPTPTVVGLKLSKEDCNKSVNPTIYKSMVGSLMYLITQLDMMHAISLIFKFMEIQKDSHWKVGKRIIRYVNGTKGFGILYIANYDFKLVVHADSDWVGSLD